MTLKIAITIVTISLLLTILIQCTTGEPEPKDPAEKIQRHVMLINTMFENQLQTLHSLISKGATQEQIQGAFQELRLIYKEMEWAVAYFMPETSRFTNGPALDEIELDENAILEAEGLQVLEENIYPVVDTARKEEMGRLIKKLSNKRLAIDTYFEANRISVEQVMDALRSQLFRIMTLGITGFDTPVSGNGLKEAIAALSSIADVLNDLKLSFKNKSAVTGIFKKIDAANNVLERATDRDHFNYLAFISDHLNSISKDLLALRLSEKIASLKVTKALRDTASTMFSQGAFDPDAFVPGTAYKQTPAKVALGKVLFSSKLLSRDSTRSCASCHQSALAFTDGLKTATALGGRPLIRNTPSLNYCNFQHGQFWDMRRVDLETQAQDVITNKDEMHGSLSEIVKKLNTDARYKDQFKWIYETDSIVAWQLQNVLSAYVRSLSFFSSRFDQYMRGEKSAMTENQKKGFNLFVGKAKCATCHFIPLFNGTVPPEYTKTESEVLGVSQNFLNRALDPDLGRGRFHETIDQVQHAFKTPTLRNIAQTAPYMHNGGYKTLQQVMEFYNEGGGQAFGYRIANQTLPPEKLLLTQDEINQIIDFMEALTDLSHQ